MQALRLNESRERCNLRLSEEIVSSIDAARAKRPGFISRNSWIAEAILEKLSKEGVRNPRQSKSANDV
jgi:metal-responsive CopG/Arc/MetJ family transcriptional regulator